MINNKKTLVLLDIDGTLINEKYDVTSDKIYEVIKKCTSKEVLFSLNSNRAKEDLLPIYQQFNLNGFMIGENGAFVLYPDGTSTFFVDSKEVDKLKQELPTYLSAKFPDGLLLYEDTVSFIKNPRKISATKVFLANEFRKFTMSIHIRQNDDGKLSKDLELTNTVANAISELIGKLNLNLRVAVSPAFCNVLVMPKNCDKGTTFKKVRDQKYKDYEIVMIGDDRADAVLMPVVDNFYAVGNARDDIKNEADYVSEKNYTEGVVDILLNKILKIQEESTN